MFDNAKEDYVKLIIEDYVYYITGRNFLHLMRAGCTPAMMHLEQHAVVVLNKATNTVVKDRFSGENLERKYDDIFGV